MEIFDGLKLSAGGELGVGVGEEEWGSGERAVLEDFVARTDGLVDLVVSRFQPSPSSFPSSAATTQQKSRESVVPPNRKKNNNHKWLGTRAYPDVSDGVIFSGVGGAITDDNGDHSTISRHSLVTISQWMEWIFRYGDGAYGVGRDPLLSTSTTARRKRSRKKKSRKKIIREEEEEGEHGPLIPRPLVMATTTTADDAGNNKGEGEREREGEGEGEGGEGPEGNNTVAATTATAIATATGEGVGTGTMTRTGTMKGLKDGTETVLKYLTLGYGSPWSLWQHDDDQRHSEGDRRTDAFSAEGAASINKGDNHEEEDDDDEGSFVIGLHRIPPEEQDDDDDDDNVVIVNDGQKAKIKIRLVHVSDATGERPYHNLS